VKSTPVANFYEQLLRQYSFDKILRSQTVSKAKLHKTLWFKKAACKTLATLTPGVPEKIENVF